MRQIISPRENHCPCTDFQEFSTLLDLIGSRAEILGERAGYIFLTDGETQETRLTYRQLERKALAVASALQSCCNPGDRVLLICPPGLEFITALFGSMCAGMVPVPAYPPHANQSPIRLESITVDSGATFALGTASVLNKLEQRHHGRSRLAELQFLAVEQIPLRLADSWNEPRLNGDSLAVLQYTSGSTRKPRGVMVSHSNLLHNCALIHDCFGQPSDFTGVSWLPPYHDMGLAGSIIYPLFAGGLAVLMSPFHFLQKPARWLETITRYQATISGGPNFAYDLCVRRITPEQQAAFDLASWEVAYNGAEPVRAETMDRFAEAFETCGFRRKSFRTCYGLAEATLIVTGQRRDAEYELLHVDEQALRANRLVPVSENAANGRALIGCGGATDEQRLLIVDPQNGQCCNTGDIGEVWVAGRSVTLGYWDHPEETRESFNATLADTGEGTFLRTGDLGFIHRGELFVAGRLKDLIVIRGLNHYPNDIELTVERSHEALRSDCGAAFSVDVDNEEQLVIVQEVERKFLRNSDFDGVIDSIRQAISEEHELQVHAVVLIKPFSIPKTSSGKIQRHLCRTGFLDGTLEVVAQSVGQVGMDMLPAESARSSRIEERPEEDPLQLDGTLGYVLRQKVAQLLHSVPGSIDPKRPLKTMGIDSLMVFELKLSIETDIGVDIPMEAIFMGASIADLEAHILWEKSRPGSKRSEGPLAALPNGRGSGDKSPLQLDTSGIPSQKCIEQHRFEDFPELRNLRQLFNDLTDHGVTNPYFKEYKGVNRDTALIGKRKLVSFSNYNYLGLSGHPAVTRAAKEAIDRFGTSVSASRLVSGERPLHRELEDELASLVGAEDCISYVSGHATNVTTIGHLFGEDDLIVYDALIHNSILQGCELSGAHKHAFPHNDWHTLDEMLHASRSRYRRVLILIEGLYGMDGDIPDLPEFIEVKKRHRTLLMVDEAHSIGVLGENGRGIGEHFSIDPSDVDLWMGTLSKSFASCGGYIGCCRPLAEYLKYTVPGFVYSVGMTPANAAAALASIRLLKKEPQRVSRLRNLSNSFLEMARDKGLNTGTSMGFPIIPVIVGDSLDALRLSQVLLTKGIDVMPMIYPAVQDGAARLRFFINCDHTMDQIDQALDTLAKALHRTRRLRSVGRFAHRPPA